MRYLKKPLYSDAEILNYVEPCSFAMLMQKQIQVLLTVGIFSVRLREDLENGRFRRVFVALPSLPTSISIPLHSIMDVPLPFSPSTATNFSSCHLAQMTTKDSIESDEWTGFYSIKNILGEPITFDPPMRNIRFVATANTTDAGILTMHGTGKDAVGAFVLDGELVRKTGQMRLQKVYAGGFPVWDWACLMTPVGIVDSWGRNFFGGWIWLWKNSRTADHHLL